MVCKKQVRTRANIANRRKEIRTWLAELKKTMACKCGETHPACLDFHHLNTAEKVTEISTSINKGWGKARILKEISKCEVLCSNCHRKLHSDIA